MVLDYIKLTVITLNPNILIMSTCCWSILEDYIIALRERRHYSVSKIKAPCKNCQALPQIRRVQIPRRTGRWRHLGITHRVWPSQLRTRQAWDVVKDIKFRADTVPYAGVINTYFKSSFVGSRSLC